MIPILSLLISVVDFNQAYAEQYSHIRASLRKKGRPTGETDALIAAIALAHNATLVTDNIKHFQNIDGLVLENWLPEQVVKQELSEKGI
ncbi:type II toxin-antitoxin system VapC family toxin [Candidatus Parabeggiatoa sp. HSG14]|uniref:type II toxin-antitoxin system VapC family toxin n=1 Tax=Candidatus Parabeggiatoa sp. HSG14 TaxID=3055593 RepID=UPI0032E3E3A4